MALEVLMDKPFRAREVDPVFLVQPGESRGRFRVVGELDLSTGPLLEAAVAADMTAPGDVVLDFSDVLFVDCAGLRSLLALAARAKGRTVVTRVRPSVRRLFDLLGVGRSKILAIE